jgi:hypothetical protein
MSHLLLFFKIRHNPQTSQQALSTNQFGVLYRQAIKAIDSYTGQMLSSDLNLG